MEKSLRYAVIIGEAEKENVKFEDLKIGDRFRLFESDGSPVKDQEGNAEFIATSEPFFDWNIGSWAIKYETTLRDRKGTT